jgi:hypothetical protein
MWVYSQIWLNPSMDDHHFFNIFLWMIVTLAIIHLGVFFSKKNTRPHTIFHLARGAGGCSRTYPIIFWKSQMHWQQVLATKSQFFFGIPKYARKWKARKACKHGHRYAISKDEWTFLEWDMAIIHSYWMKPPPGANGCVGGGWHLGVPKDLI